ncbi:MAG: FAD-dependent oxidoreductase [bacterium]|nr:FAD-dependent oxidoreductase [bacterium]
MADVLIVGDGPAGLSAALFLAKNGMSVTVFGVDATPMHKAMLYNYLGIPEMTGTEFQRLSRDQVVKLGAKIVNEEVSTAEKTGSGFSVKTANGNRHDGKYLILASGTNTRLAEELGLQRKNKGIVADEDGKTSVPGLYAVGWNTRLIRTQAIISAGQGASAALEILSAEAGADVHDFDVVS